jgi:TolA-binding protein
MPEEILILSTFLIFSVSVLTLVKMILNHRKSKHEVRTQVQDSGSLTLSELESMMKRAVEHSITGLSGKIEDLELEVARLSSTQNQLPEHQRASRLELEDEIMDVDPVAARRKTKA